jgi:hypothetical protein
LELQILVRGQSNAILLMEAERWSGAGQLSSEVQRLLGFDGVTDRVNVLYTRGDEERGTGHGASAFLGDWMQRAPDGSWQPGPKELGLLRSAAELDSPAASSTAVLWLHSEYDSFRADLDPAEWMSVVRQDAALVRAALGGDAASVPYHFVSAHPYEDGTPEGHQAIRFGMERLAADPSFHARIAARALDIDASLDDLDADWRTVDYGGAHITPQDGALILARAARTIAEDWADYAKPGSPVSVAGGDIADTGPRVMAAERIAPDTLRLVVAQDQGGVFAPLDPDAAKGLGWTVFNPQGTAAVGARSATVVGPHTIDLAFDGPLPVPEGRLHYGWGVGRLAEGNAPGQGNAITDQAGLPIWTPAEGIQIGLPAVYDDALWLR